MANKDLELWAALGDAQTPYPHETLPPREEFLRECALYHESRLAERLQESVERTKREIAEIEKSSKVTNEIMNLRFDV